MLSRVCPGVWRTTKVKLPSLKTCWSLAIVTGYEVIVLGPKIIGAPVALESVKWPLTKSAWMWVSNIYFILK